MLHRPWSSILLKLRSSLTRGGFPRSREAKCPAPSLLKLLLQYKFSRERGRVVNRAGCFSAAAALANHFMLSEVSAELSLRFLLSHSAPESEMPCFERWSSHSVLLTYSTGGAPCNQAGKRNPPLHL